MAVCQPRASVFSRITSLRRLKSLLLVVVCFAARGFSHGETPETEYLLRIVHEDWNGTSCVLLQDDSAFHYENGYGSTTKVYEGEVPATQMSGVRGRLNKLAGVSQGEIEEPLIRRSRDMLLISVYESDQPHDLLFRSKESQEPYRISLGPLVRWMDDLPHFAKRELSEDAGKQNCLPRRELALKKRSDIATDENTLPTMRGSQNSTTAHEKVDRAPAPLLQLSMFTMGSEGAQQSCALVIDDGRFRYEDRTQKSGSKKVRTKIARGQMSAEDIWRLHAILDAPDLTKLQHREPPGGMELRIMGSVLELSIQRATGVQELVLTDSTHRSVFFYPGDGDIALAGPLLGFVRQSFAGHAVPSLNPAERNGCTEAP